MKFLTAQTHFVCSSVRATQKRGNLNNFPPINLPFSRPRRQKRGTYITSFLRRALAGSLNVKTGSKSRGSSLSSPTAWGGRRRRMRPDGVFCRASRRPKHPGHSPGTGAEGDGRSLAARIGVATACFQNIRCCTLAVRKVAIFGVNFLNVTTLPVCWGVVCRHCRWIQQVSVIFISHLFFCFYLFLFFLCKLNFIQLNHVIFKTNLFLSRQGS